MFKHFIAKFIGRCRRTVFYSHEFNQQQYKSEVQEYIDKVALEHSYTYIKEDFTGFFYFVYRGNYLSSFSG